MNLGQLAHVVQVALDQRLEAAADVSGPEFELLWRLESTGGRKLQMTEIAGLLLASKSGVTRLVDRLVEVRLVDARSLGRPPRHPRAAHPACQDQSAKVQDEFAHAFEVAFSTISRIATFEP